MSLKTWLVDIADIECSEQGFLNEERAHLIYKLGGCAKPMVLREIGIKDYKMHYKVVCGVNTYRDIRYLVEELDTEGDFEMIRCYVATSDEEEAMLTELYEMS